MDEFVAPVKGAVRLRLARDLVILMLLLVTVVAPQQANAKIISVFSQDSSSTSYVRQSSTVTTNETGTTHTTYQVNVAQTTSITATQAQLANWTAWHRYISQKSASGTGCFEAKYPNSVWQRTTCAAPVVGHESPAPTSSTIGNGDSNDYSAESPSAYIGSAVGSFPSTTGLTSETDVCVAPFLNICTHSPQTNYYSLQVNAEEGFPVTFNGWTGTGWQQFIYDNTPSGGYVWIEYWLFGYYTAHGNTCPPASENPPGNPSGDNWFTDDNGNCVYNTASQSTPYEPPTSLSSLSLGAFANLTGSGYDEVKLFVNGGDGYEWSEPASVLNLYKQWQLAEFNVFGYIDGSQAQFNPGTSITVANSLTDHSNSAIAPSCDKVSETGETNNLNLGSSGSCLSINNRQIAFTESNLASWVTVSVYSDDLQFKGQNPLSLTDLNGGISNNYQNEAGLTTYLFSIPTNTQVTLSIAQAPNGWYFTDDWDDYGVSQYLGFSSLTINVGTSNHEVAAFFTYIATFQQSGIPSGTTWGVTVEGTRYTDSGSYIELIGLDGTVSYSYDPIVTGTSGVQYSCISECSGSISGPTTVTASYQAVPTTAQTSTSSSTTSTTTSSTSTFLTTTTTTSISTSTIGQVCTATSTTQTTNTIIQAPVTSTTATTTATTTTGTSTFLTTISSTTASTTITTATVTVCTQTSTSTSTSTTQTTFTRPATTISLLVNPNTTSIGSPVTLSGSITQSPGPVQVTVSTSQNSGSTWTALMIVTTDNSGSYSTGWTPQYPGSYLVEASWSGNDQLAGSTSPAQSLTVTGTPTPTPTLLLSAPSSGPPGQPVQLSITVFNPTSSSLNANVMVKIMGPNNYVMFDVVQVNIAAASHSTAYYVWMAPNQSGTYSVTADLSPSPSGVSTATIQIT